MPREADTSAQNSGVADVETRSELDPLVLGTRMLRSAMPAWISLAQRSPTHR